ncbi:hypothetical protein TIFTF001_042877 [Ficus carica]|uniref:Uncharacterized protein n=1 Tax=Ficus carica TaxID=3494 RepID=A0AA87YP53_FICCA|nr:hypothetical protein TIFTF001_042877 [Ficus carica]
MLAAFAGSLICLLIISCSLLTWAINLAVEEVQSAKVDCNGLDSMAEDGEKQKIVNDSDLAHENDEWAKKKRKVVKTEKKNVDIEYNKDGQEEAKDSSVVQNLSRTAEK